MCLAVPGKIISINNNDPNLKMAKVQFGGIIKDICIEWLDDPKTGEYVMAHVGTALSKVDEADALITLNALHQMGEITEEQLE
jgi:hydrogenase expression/formation protein HypC